MAVYLCQQLESQSTMGKTRRDRKKFHLSVSGENTAKNEMETETNPELFHASPLLRIEDDIFKGIDINIDTLTTNSVEDDRRSVKSFKSLKSELSENKKILPKKHKLQLRRELFLKKMGNVYQVKGNNQLRQRKNKVAVSENFHLLNDALPSLQSLLHTSEATKEKSVVQPIKLKGVQKARKRKKEMVKEVGIYKKVLSNEKFKTNSLAAIAEHIKTVCQ